MKNVVHLKVWILVLGAIVALGIGGAAGASGSKKGSAATAATAATAAPVTRTITSVVTKTIKVNVPGPTHTVTVTKNVNVTPQACTDALDEANKGFTVAADASTTMTSYTQVVVDAFKAISNSDAAGLDAATAKIAQLVKDIENETARMTAINPVYHSAEAACLGQ